ncbi:hypothetical protein [Aetokthonos hydrillicola]
MIFKVLIRNSPTALAPQHHISEEVDPPAEPELTRPEFVFIE